MKSILMPHGFIALCLVVSALHSCAAHSEPSSVLLERSPRTEAAPAARTLQRPLQSARRATELVLASLREHGLDQGSIELWQLSARHAFASDGRPERIKVQLETTFRGEGALAATRSYETLLAHLRRLPGILVVQPASTSELPDGTGASAQGLRFELVLPEVDLGRSAEELDFAIRSAAADGIGPIDIRVRADGTPEARAAERLPRRLVQPFHRTSGLELARILSFLEQLELGAPAACVVSVKLERAAHRQQGEGELSYGYAFEAEIAPQP